MAGYSLTITAVDAATGVVDKINQRMEGLTKRITAAQAPMKRFGENFDKLSKVSGVTHIATGFRSVAAAGTEAFRSLARVIEPLSAIAGAASIAGMYKLAGAWGEFAHTLEINANRASMTQQSLQGLSNAAKLAGVSGETTARSMTSLADKMRDAQFGGGAGFLLTLKSMGVSYAELQRQSPEQQIRTIAEALSHVHDATDRAQFGREIFGGEDFIPFLKQGADGIERMTTRARELGGALTDDDLARLRQFWGVQKELTLAAQGLGDTIAATVGPALIPLLAVIRDMSVQMRLWLEANKDWLRDELTKKVQEFATWLKGIDWHEVGESIKAVGTTVSGVVDALGGWKTAGEVVLAFFAVSWLAGMLLPLLTVMRLLTGLPGAAGAAVGLTKVALGGLAAHEALKAVDPKDAIGGWIDRNIPGAAAVDNFASRFGLGRSYAQQAEVERDRTAVGVNVDREGRGSGHGGRNTPLPQGEKATRARHAFDAFVAMGDSRQVAAGRVANMHVESGFNEKAVGDGGQAFGLLQAHPDRQAQFTKMFGHDMQHGTFDEQLKFIHDDPDGQSRINNQMLQRNKQISAYDAAGFISDRQERPADKAGNRQVRGDLAQSYERRFDEQDVTRARGPAVARGEAAPLPSAQGGQGAPGSNGRVDVNVRVLGAPAVVTAQGPRSVPVAIHNPGMIGQ